MAFKSDWGRVDVSCKVETNVSEKFVEVFCIDFQIFDFFISYTIFFAKFCFWIVSFPIASLIRDHVFLILSLYLTVKVEQWSFFVVFSLFQTVAYSFCIYLHFFYFSFLETSHTVVAYVWKICLYQLFSRDFEYLCFQPSSFT